MRCPFPRILASLLICVLPAATTRAADPTDAQVRAAIKSSLPFLEREGVAWMNERKCMSCHTVTFILWSFNLARSRGIDIDGAKLAQWTQWSLGKSLAARGPYELTKASFEQLQADAIPAKTLADLQPLRDQKFPTQEAFRAALASALTPDQFKLHATLIDRRAAPPNKGGENDGGGLNTLSQLLLSRAAGVNDSVMSRFLSTTPALMLAWQKPDGHWQAAGQMPSQDRPKDESDTVTTRWAALALGTVESPDASTTQSLTKALQVTRDAKPAATTESTVTQFLIDRRFGKSSDPADLLKRQNPDGGWPWRQTGPSDAYSTGQALYALTQSPITPNLQPPIDRARRYLLQIQQPDGTWPTTGQGISNAATPQRKKKVEPIYHYWGAAWATIGLASSLPPR